MLLSVMYDAPCGSHAGGDDEDGIVSLSSDLAATRNVVVAVSHNDCRVWDFVQGRLLHGLPYSSVCKGSGAAALALLEHYCSACLCTLVVPQETGNANVHVLLLQNMEGRVNWFQSF
jgi:hypothetical protein